MSTLSASGATTRLLERLLVVDPDPSARGRVLAGLLERMSPFDALRTVAIAARSPLAPVRRIVAEALSLVPLDGDELVVDALSHDASPAVRGAATRAAHARREEP